MHQKNRRTITRATGMQDRFLDRDVFHGEAIEHSAQSSASCERPETIVIGPRIASLAPRYGNSGQDGAGHCADSVSYTVPAIARSADRRDHCLNSLDDGGQEAETNERQGVAPPEDHAEKGRRQVEQDVRGGLFRGWS
jgi:hypothetical protein